MTAPTSDTLMPFDEGVRRTVESVRGARGGHRA